MKRQWRSMRTKVLPPVLYAFVRLLGWTLRIESHEYERLGDIGRGVIFAGWHGRTLVPALFFRNKGVWTIISRSRDGNVQNAIFTRLGFNTIRGSTGRGGVKAAVESIRVLKKGATMAFTPDGPRGPSGVVQGGVVLMAKKSGAALVACGVSASHKWHVPTWDSYMVPWPFARCVLVFGDPIFVSKDASDEEVEAARGKLEAEIHRVQKSADDWYVKRR
ncbi:MAG: lysophospholipid acyltransferase family protein [Fimbriimonadaceae bacterium]